MTFERWAGYLQCGAVGPSSELRFGQPTCTHEHGHFGGHSWESKRKAMKQETIAVPVEVVRELKTLASLKGWNELPSRVKMLGEAIRAIPDPPKPDVVEECFAAWARGQGALIDTSKERMRAALLRYRELGCPELDEP